MSDNAPPSPLPSATVIVLRERKAKRPQQFELFMVRRADRSSFMGGAHVFPGGKVDEADLHPNMQALCDGLESASVGVPALDGALLPAAEAAAFRLAALRELFEEAGVLLARDNTGTFVSFESPEKRDRFAGYRVAAQQFSLPLVMVLAEEGLRFDVSALTPWAWWVTPQEERKRFDARFFLARMPENQEAMHDNQETTTSAWFSPAEALERYRNNEIHLVPPTLRTLEELSSYETLEELWAAAQAKVITRIQPRLVTEGEKLMILLPGDSEHPAEPGQAVSGATRFVMEGGRWWSRQG